MTRFAYTSACQVGRQWILHVFWQAIFWNVCWHHLPMNPRLSVQHFLCGQEETEVKPVIVVLEYSSFLPSVRLPSPLLIMWYSLRFIILLWRDLPQSKSLWHRLWQRHAGFGLYYPTEKFSGCWNLFSALPVWRSDSQCHLTVLFLSWHWAATASHTGRDEPFNNCSFPPHGHRLGFVQWKQALGSTADTQKFFQECRDPPLPLAHLPKEVCMSACPTGWGPWCIAFLSLS